jgi:2-polyprenyl-3-methyl-5-hydroxy-6-metoxy-1,4-benzoquinol methylase
VACAEGDLEDQKDRVRAHYGQWAATYGDPTDDGLFAWVRAREVRLVHEMLDIAGASSVLDAGCGSGVYSKALHTDGHEVWAVDFAPEMVERVRGHVTRCQQADVEELALGRLFDRVLCVGVLEWVKCGEAAIARLADHVAPGGRLVVLVPRTGPGGWIYEHQKRKHGLAPHLYSTGAMRHMGEAAGLRYRRHVTPWVHNFVMSFEAPPVQL